MAAPGTPGLVVPPPVRRVGWLARGLYVVLILGLAAEVWGHSPTRALGLAGVATLLPGLPGLLRGRPYTAQWVSLWLVIVAGWLLSQAWMHPARRVPELALAVLAALAFAAVALWVKGLKSAAAAQGVRLRPAPVGGFPADPEPGSGPGPDPGASA